MGLTDTRLHYRRESMSFKIGDRVKWTSQAGGYAAEKTGTVVAVIPVGRRFGLLKYLRPLNLDEARACYNTGPIDGAGLARDHESYLVEVKTGKTDAAKKTLYWPRVKGLALVAAPVG
jgi:hypothetical protein